MGQRREPELRLCLCFDCDLIQFCGHPSPASGYRECFPGPASRPAPPLPHVRGFPARGVLPAGPTSIEASAFLRLEPFGLRTRPAARTTMDLPGSWVLSFPSVPCSQTPPRSPATIAFCGCLPWPSKFSTLSALGCITRLHRFTCVTARMSLCLRLAHFVTSMRPRLDSRWGGCPPFRGGNFTR